MLAVLNAVMLSLMDSHHVSNVANQLRRFSAQTREALARLMLDRDFWEVLHEQLAPAHETTSLPQEEVAGGHACVCFERYT